MVIEFYLPFKCPLGKQMMLDILSTYITYILLFEKVNSWLHGHIDWRLPWSIRSHIISSDHTTEHIQSKYYKLFLKSDKAAIS